MQYSRAKGQNHFTRTAGHPSFEAAHNAAGLPEPVGLCPAFCPWELPNPSLQGCTQWVHLPSPGAAPCSLTCWTSWGSQGPSSQVCPGPLDGIPFFSCINGTAQLHVLCRLAEDTFDLTVSLIKVLKSTGPKVESWGTPLITGLHLDTEPLTKALWLHCIYPAKSLSTTAVHPLSPCL